MLFEIVTRESAELSINSQELPIAVKSHPLATIATARKYASLHIYDRIQVQIRKAEAMQP